MNQAGIVACCAVCELPTYRRCSRCQLVYYCNTEHQQGDWRRHKTECLSKSTKAGRKHKSKSSSNSSSPGVRLEKPDQKVPSDSATVANKREGDSDRTHCNATNSDKSDGQISEEASTCTSKHNSVISSVVHAYQDTNVKSAITDEGSSEQEILTESAQQLSMVDFAAPGSSNASPPTNHTNKPEMKMPLPEGTRREYPEGVLRPNIAPALSNTDNIEGQGLEICNRLIRDMSEYGVCVLDNFLGRDKGLLVLKEVLSMYRSGIFAPGQLVSAHRNAQTIRSDRITWIDGKEPQCKFIGQLISQVDSIVLKANKMANNDKMGEYNITGRTKAMVACYPGSGSHYVKHVDNPNKDGRCITAIYYLNLDWDVERNGGLLRVFPEGRNEVADIAPLFDRMLFFWSDRRNPHEVQPAFGTRYAITLWYFDAFEREVARSHFVQRAQPAESSSK